MASYRPKQELHIAEPCTADWDEMQGNARSRHCAVCGHDVHNLAAMTPAQIEALLSASRSGNGRVPCVRMAQFDDGSLLVAEEMRTGPALGTKYGAMAGAMLSALVTISSVAGCAKPPLTGFAAQQQGASTVPHAVYAGQVVYPGGQPAANALVALTRVSDGQPQRIEAHTDASGHFRLLPAPGTWQVSAATAAQGDYAAGQSVTLQPGEQQTSRRLEVRVVTVTAGVPAAAPAAPPATRSPGTSDNLTRTMGKIAAP